MKAVFALVCAVALLDSWHAQGRAADQASPKVAPAMPAGVRELTFDIPKCRRQKQGPSVAVGLTRAQLEQELGQEVGRAVWRAIDPNQEVVVVLGLWDTCMDPAYDGFLIREIKAGGATTLRFKCNPGNDQPFRFYLEFAWPTRCMVYAAPRGAAVGLD